MKILMDALMNEPSSLTIRRMNIKEDTLLTSAEDHLRKAGFHTVGFGSNEHWDNGDIMICLNGDSAQWFDDGICTDLSLSQLHSKLSSL